MHAQVKSPGLGQAKPGPALIEGCRLGLGFQQAPSPQKPSPARGLKPKPGLHITRFEERLFVGHGEWVRSVTPSSMNDSPEVRKGWLECGSSVDGNVDEVVVGEQLRM